MIKHLLLISFIPLVLVLSWFRGGGLIASSEEGLFLYNSEVTYQFSSSTWLDYNTGAGIVTFLPRKSLAVAMLAADALNIPLTVFQALLLFILMATAGIFFYLLVSYFFVDETSSAVALYSSIFYLLNPYVMSQVWRRALYSQYFLIALLPLALLLFIKGLQTKRIIYIVLFALAGLIFSTAFTLPTNIIVFWFVMLTYFLSTLLRARSIRNFLTATLYCLGVLSVWIITNFWWLLPLFASKESVYFANVNPAENIGTLIGLSPYFHPMMVVRLIQGFIFFSSESFGQIYKSFIFNLISWLPPFLVVIGVIKIRKNIKTLFWIFILLIGYFISIGANFPFGDLFVWVFKKITLLQAFRNPYEKFGIVFVLAYSFFFGYGLFCISKVFSEKRKKTIIFFVLSLTVGIYVWPMWSGDVHKIAGTIGLKIPSYYQNANKFLRTSSGDYRILTIPIIESDSLRHNWDGDIYTGIETAVYLFGRPNVGNIPQIPLMQNIYKNICSINTAPALSLLRIKYLVARRDLVGVDYSRDECVTRLGNMERKSGEFKKVEEFGALMIYEPNKFVSPPEFGEMSGVLTVRDFVDFFKEIERNRNNLNTLAFVIADQNPGKVLSGLPEVNQKKIVNSKQAGKARYWVSYEKGVKYLLLSNTYDPNWIVLTGFGESGLKNDFTTNLKLLRKNKLSEDKHFVANGYANLWKIDDESRDALVVFKPELYANIGWSVTFYSVIFVGSCLGLYLMRFFRKKTPSI